MSQQYFLIRYLLQNLVCIVLKHIDISSKLVHLLLGRIVEEIKNAYTEELKIKRCIAENVAHCSTREEINFYGVGWSYQTSITAIIKRKFESLLIETDRC